MIVLNVAILAALMLSTAITTAQPAVIAPENSTFSVLMVNAEGGEAGKRIIGLEAIQEPTKTESVSEIEHAAHNSLAEDKPIGPSDAGISILSVPDATTGGIVWRIEVPGAVHQTAISSDERCAVAIHRSGNGISVINLMSFTPTVYAELCPCGRVARDRSIG